MMAGEEMVALLLVVLLGLEVVVSVEQDGAGSGAWTGGPASSVRVVEPSLLMLVVLGVLSFMACVYVRVSKRVRRIFLQ